MAFLGMRGTGDWVTNEAPEDWESGILRLFPNGTMTITNILSMMSEQGTDDSTFHWWTKTLQSQKVTGTVGSFAYIDANCLTAYVYASHQATYGIAGGVIYFKMTTANSKNFRAGHKVIIRDSDELSADIRAKVVGTAVLDGTYTAVACKLQEADDNGRTAATYNIASADALCVVGSYSPQGAPIPTAIAQDPTEFYNYTGISRFPLSLTRTAIKTKLRTAQAYEEAKMEALMYFGIEREKDLIFSLRQSTTGANGMPEKTPMGMIEFIKTYGTSGEQYDDFRVNSNYSGKTWKQAGEDWLDAMVKYAFKWGDGTGQGEKLAVCGDGALLGIQQIVKQSGNYTLQPMTSDYGIKVTGWHTVFGSLNLKLHPLFSVDSSLSNRVLIFEPRNIKRRFIDKAFFKGDDSWKKGGVSSIDGLLEEWLCEDGYEFHHAQTFQLLDGVGLDNAV